jgi:beta-N-acetylglucosaminidase
MYIFKRKISLWSVLFKFVICFCLIATTSIVWRAYTAFVQFDTFMRTQEEYNRTMTEENSHRLEKMEKEFKQFKEFEQKKEQLRNQSINNLKATGFTTSTDLGKNIYLDASDIDKIINSWDSKIDNGTRFKGKGEIFIEASRETGLNPIYILAHAATESNWGKSPIAMDKHNYFGINCIDTNPSAGYIMGDNMYDGIVGGAKWIQMNFYNNGYKTLDGMKKANYATDKKWERNIVNIMNESVKLL